MKSFKKSLLGLVAAVALVVLALLGAGLTSGGVAQAATNRSISVFGQAWEYNNTHCGHDCLVIAEAYNGTQRVWNTSDVACSGLLSDPCMVGPCPSGSQGHSFNFGYLLDPEFTSCNNAFFFMPSKDARWRTTLWTGYVIKTWVRHACVGGAGYYFSPTNTHTLTLAENHNIWMGSMTLPSPGSGCQP